MAHPPLRDARPLQDRWKAGHGHRGCTRAWSGFSTGLIEGRGQGPQTAGVFPTPRRGALSGPGRATGWSGRRTWGAGFRIPRTDRRVRPHGERDAFSFGIHLDHGDLDLLARLHDLGGVLDEAVGDLADVHESILVHADIDEGSEGGDVGDDAGEAHAGFEILDLMNSFGEGEDLELLAGIASRAGQLREDVLKGRETDVARDITGGINPRPDGCIPEQGSNIGSQVLGHGIDDGIAFWMDRGRIQRVGGVADAEKSGALFEGFRAEARDLQKLASGLEGAVGIAVGDDVGGEGGAETRHIGEKLAAGGVEFDPDTVDAGDDDVVEAALELALIHVVLVLADADGLGIELYQFREGIHQAASDADGSADGDVMVRELLAGDVGGGVDGRPGFVDEDDGDGCREAEGAHELFGFAAGGAVADGDGLDLEAAHEFGEHEGGFAGECGRGGDVQDVVVEEFPLTIETHEFASGTEAGIEREDVAAAESGSEEEFAEIVGEDADGLGVGLFLGFHPDLGFERKTQEAAVGILHGETHLFTRGLAWSEHEESFEDVEGEVFGRGDPDEEEAFGFAAADGEQAMTGNGGEGFGPGEVVLELGGLRLLSGEDLGTDGGLLPEQFPQTGAGHGIIGDPLGEDVTGTGEGGGGIGHTA